MKQDEKELRKLLSGLVGSKETAPIYVEEVVRFYKSQLNEAVTNVSNAVIESMENPTDINQASELFELCKEVYELTSWKDTHSRLDDGNHTIRNEGNEVLLGSKQAPLYTSDYLLQKLPSSLNDEEGDAYILTVRKFSDSWLANYTFDNVAMWHRYGDTPLLSLLKLTIAISEAGELK